ncbi:hypothetical protein [Deinococcus roseus]|uniref:Peptidase M30 n=1 Tax=Deinococcus roseus TaxID=392414 RepID=A0ABQ2CUD2_9DEIO|nr:hypothetical protein [Deinococcus roseus]GGJ21566.1 hypothetical protein GCM10008938_04690 [Deinococcus roseus]
MQVYKMGLLVLASVALVGCRGNQVVVPPVVNPDYEVKTFRPGDFQAGQVSVTLKNLSSNESVAVIPVNAEQPDNPDGFGYTLQVDQVQAPFALAEPHSIQQQQQDSVSQIREQIKMQHHQFLQNQQALMKEASQLGLKSLKDSKLEPQVFNTCAKPKVGDLCSYWVYGTEDQVKVTTKMRYISPNAYWFVDQNDAADLSDAELAKFAKTFEEKLFLSDKKYFGSPADFDGNGKIKIVFSKEVANGGAFGYVYGADWYPDAEIYKAWEIHSNEGDIFYAATPSSFEPDISRSSMLSYDLPSTLVHELKHLIAGGQRFQADFPDEESWIEEASAVSAEELSGYGTQMGDYARNMASVGMLSPQNVRVYLSDNSQFDESRNFYGYNFLFIWRLAEQVGHDKFWKTWTVSNAAGKANLSKITGKSFADLMLDWAQTLMFSNTGINNQFNYKSLNLREGLTGNPASSWRPLGYRVLKSLKDTTRSMAYYVGRGQNKDATITLKTDFERPYLLVVRFKGALPWQPARTLAGTLKVPAGQDTNGLTLIACQLQDGVCTEDSIKRKVPVPQNGQEATFSITGLAGEKYQLEAYRDVNKSKVRDAGDLYGCVKNGDQCAQLTPTQEDLQLNVSVM